MKKLLWIVMAILMVATCGLVTACGGNDGDDTPVDTLTVSMTETASQVATNVGIVLYNEVKLNGTATTAEVEYTVEGANAATATIGNLAGNVYFSATADGEYTIKATATKDALTASATKTITVSDEVDVSTIYSVGYKPDIAANIAQVVVSKDGFFYGGVGGTRVETPATFVDLWLANNQSSFVGDFEFTIPVKTTVANTALFFSFHGAVGAAAPGWVGDFAVIETNKMRVASTTLGEVISFDSLTYVKIVRKVDAETTTFGLFTSTDGTNFTLYLKDTVANNGQYNADITGLVLFCNGGVFFGDYTMTSNVTTQIPA